MNEKCSEMNDNQSNQSNSYSSHIQIKTITFINNKKLIASKYIDIADASFVDEFKCSYCEKRRGILFLRNNKTLKKKYRNFKPKQNKTNL